MGKKKRQKGRKSPLFANSWRIILVIAVLLLLLIAPFQFHWIEINRRPLTLSSQPAKSTQIIATTPRTPPEQPPTLLARLSAIEPILNHDNLPVAIQTLYELLQQYPEPEAQRRVKARIQHHVSGQIKRLEELGDWVALTQFCRFLIHLDPTYPPYRFKLAQAQMALGNYQDAIETVNLLQYDQPWQKTADKIIKEATEKQRSHSQEETIVPLIAHGTGFLLDAVINRQLTARLMLDTGATLSIITPSLLAKLNMNQKADAQTEQIFTAKGAMEVPTVTLDELAVQDRIVTSVRVGIIDAMEAANFDGLLGMDFLSHYQFIINPADKKLYLSDKRQL